jgi:hypothetical protein
MRRIRRVITTYARTHVVVVMVVAVNVLWAIWMGALHLAPSAPVRPTPTLSYTYVCKDNTSSTSCIQAKYQRVTQESGAAEAFKQLKVAYKSDPAVREACHQVVHAIGRTAADLAPDVATTYSQGDNMCWSGFYHGAIESVSRRLGKASLASRLPTICASLKAQRAYSFYHYNCVHGLGHGVMDVNDSDLPASLAECDLLHDSWEQQSCWGGVFMENELDEFNPDHHTVYLKADDPMYPCTMVDYKYRSQCYLMQTSHALHVSSDSFSRVFALCDGVESDFRSSCYRSVGRDASGRTVSDVEKTRDICMLASNHGAQQDCIIGAVRDFISYFHDDQQAGKLCAALEVSFQAECTQTRTDYIKTL